MVCDFLGKINACETINTAQDSFGNFALIDLESGGLPLGMGRDRGRKISLIQVECTLHLSRALGGISPLGKCRGQKPQ